MPTILVINSDNQGDWYSVSDAPLALGRDESLLAELLDPYVSRKHLEVRLDPRDGCHYAVDLGSRNGVIVNGVRVNRFKALHDGDLLQIGHTLLVYAAQDIDHYRTAERMIHKLAKRYRNLIAQIDEAAEKQRRLALLTGTNGFRAIQEKTRVSETQHGHVGA